MTNEDKWEPSEDGSWSDGYVHMLVCKDTQEVVVGAGCGYGVPAFAVADALRQLGYIVTQRPHNGGVA